MAGPWEAYQSSAPAEEGPWTAYAPQPEPRSIPQELLRQAGLTGRYAVEGGSGLANMVGNAANTLINYGVRGVNALGGNVPELGMPSEVLSRRLTDVGLPNPETPLERLVGDISRAEAGAMTGIGAGGVAQQAANPVTQAVGASLKAAPAMQAVSAATGATAAGVTREAGGGPGAQFAAGIIGGAVPSVAQAGTQAATRGAIRGGEAGRQDYANRLQAFEDAGTTPTVGQASGTRPIQSTESALAQVSASAGVLDRVAEREAREMGAKVEQLANELLPAANATKAGLTIEKGIGRFVDRFRGQQSLLYDKLDNLIPQGASVPVSNTLAKLDELATPIAGAPEVSPLIKSPALANIREKFAKDAANGQLPYDAVKQLRTVIGLKLTNPSLVDDVNTAQWKQLYGALSDDMRAAADAAGPEAAQAFARANAYTRAGHARIEGVLQKVSGKDTAEKIFLAATNPSEMRQGATTIGTVMKSLEPEERKVVTATVVRRMGLADPGQQNALGEQFSSQKFLTNWNKIDPQAKAHLFPDEQLRADLDQVAVAADMVRKGSKIFANPSGTTPALSNQLSRWTMAGAIVTGHPGLAVGFGALLTGANLSARLLTNPQFVRWLAKTTTMPEALIPTQINMLAQASQKWPAQDRAEVAAYLNGIGSAPSAPPTQ